MSDVQAFAKIALFCDKYRKNSKNPESGIDLRLVLKRFFIPVDKYFGVMDLNILPYLSQ